MAQSLFQVGGNVGSALGPLIAALVIAPFGQRSLAWLSPAALIGMAVLFQVSRWYSGHQRAPRAPSQHRASASSLSRGRVTGAVCVLLVLLFSKYFYMASIGSFFTFYLIEKFGLSVQGAQLLLFLFMFAVALGSLIGGPIGDRIGRKPVIWASILGVAPFTLALPHANLFWTGALSIVIGLTLSSAFSAILVYAQELIPGRIGMVSGLFFGFAFGMGGLGAAVLGALADRTSIDFVYNVCAFLPLLGIVAVFLPAGSSAATTTAPPAPSRSSSSATR
jgi:FSR family fosmidomycin resistance protein-like MFS transporter